MVFPVSIVELTESKALDHLWGFIPIPTTFFQRMAERRLEVSQLRAAVMLCASAVEKLFQKMPGFVRTVGKNKLSFVQVVDSDTLPSFRTAINAGLTVNSL